MQWKHEACKGAGRFLLAAGLVLGLSGWLSEASAAGDAAPAPIRSQYLLETVGNLPAVGLQRDLFLGQREDHPRRPHGMVTARNSNSRGRSGGRWQDAPPEDRRRLERRMEQWNRMPPQEREQYRYRYEQYRRLSPEEQRRLQRDLDQWDQLSPRERDAIRKKFNN